jgi:hypothetical protein
MKSAVHLPSDHSCSCQICSEHADVFGNIKPPTNAETIRPWPRKPTNSPRRTHVAPAGHPGIAADGANAFAVRGRSGFGGLSAAGES